MAGGEDEGDAQTSGTVRAIERAIDVLQAVAGRPQGLKIAELERLTGIARPTLYRLVRTLEKRRLLRATSDPTRYELDVGVVELAQTWLRSIDLVPRAEGALQALARDVGETVALWIARGDRRIHAREIASRHPLTFSRGVGITESILNGAGGIAILAHETPQAVARLLAGVGEEERRRLEGEMRTARSRGYAVSKSTIIEGATAVAAPIFNSGGAVVGSVGVYGPTVRIGKADIVRIADRLIAAAREVSALVP